MKFKIRLTLVCLILIFAVVYSIKRRFFTKRSVALDKYLEDNKDRRHILEDDLDAKQLDTYSDNDVMGNCNSSSLTWTGIPYKYDSLIVMDPNCESYASVTTVIYIYSNITVRDQRHLIRDTYGLKAIRDKYNFKLLFVTGSGDHGADKIQREFAKMALEREQLTYDDVMILNIDDVLDNNAIKGLTALKWILQCAKSVINIIKLDENTVPNLPLLFNDLNSRSVAEAHKEFFCTVETGQMIEDKNKNISKDDAHNHQKQPIRLFPPYCKGAFIVFSKHVVKQLLKAAEGRPIYKIDDVYLTGLLRESMCIPVPHRRMRIPKIVKLRTYNIGAYHYIAYRQIDDAIFRNTWQSAMVFENLIGL